MKEHINKFWPYYAAGAGALLIVLLAAYAVKQKQAKAKAEADAAAALAAAAGAGRRILSEDEKQELQDTTTNTISNSASTKGQQVSDA